MEQRPYRSNTEKKKWGITRKSGRTLLMMLAVNLLVYYPSQIFGTVGTPRDISIGIDSAFTFDARWVFIYGLAFIFWVVSYAALSNFDGWSSIAAAEMIAKLCCIFFFIFLPTTVARPQVSPGTLSETALSILYAVDKPLNLFPSIHCFDSWICGRCLMTEKKMPAAVRILAPLFSLLVFISVLKTRQHVFIDIIGGVLLAELGLFLSRRYNWGKIIDKWIR